MFHYRDSKAGKFYLDRGHPEFGSPSETPSFLRFARTRGVALDLWNGEGAQSAPLLASAGLHWTVQTREVLVPMGRDDRRTVPAPGYRALVRPDTGQVMSIVSTTYRVAENEWVARALERLCGRPGEREPVVAVASYGREGERTLFVGRVVESRGRAVCLLAYNTHGGEGAVRFQLVEADRQERTTFVLDSAHAAFSIPHVGDVEDRLMRVSEPGKETFVEKYLSETEPLWRRLSDALWTPRHTSALVKELWGDTPPLTRAAPHGGTLSTGEEHARHPGHHLIAEMKPVSDAASAYTAVCDWIDNKSEACERGDFTKDRDERLALGAGNKYKQRAWRWIVDNI